MKQKILALFVFCCVFLQATLHAQIDIPIGTGTVGNTTFTYPCPVQDYYEGSRAQYLYTAAELTAAGMSPGTVVAIKFDVQAVNTGTFPAIEQYTINIGTTSATSLSATTWESGTTAVYGPTDYTITPGINTFTFSSPFVWNGTDNIVIDICNGDPQNGTYISYTNNPIIPWTTGLSFNGSHTYISDNAGNLCGTASTLNTGTQTTRPNIIFSWIAGSACSGTPVGGTTTSTNTNITCPGTAFTLNVTGATAASGLSYQWQSAPSSTGPWTNITSATTASYTTTQTEALKFYRRLVTCGAASSSSTPVQVASVASIPYLTLPLNESFENTWINSCDVRDIPTIGWKNTPVTGDNSWRREDDAVAGAWVNPTLGAYTPPASAGSHSARFHTYQAASGSSGSLDVYVNCNTPSAVKRMFLDYINTGGTDSLSILISTNGGTTFTRLDSAGVAAAWRTKTIVFTSSSATTIIRFKATSDFGVNDIGIDNIKVADFGPCSGAPLGGSTTSSASPVCTGVSFLLDVIGSTDASGLTYQWQSSPDNVSWTNITGATQASLNRTQIVATWYRRIITCTNTGGSSSNSTAILVGVITPQYTVLPFSESFENTWISNCGLREIPNLFWSNIPVTGNTSWRRNDDAAGGAWLNPTLGAYTPTASAGVYSARFHTYATPAGSTGVLDLYVNCNTPSATKRMFYDFINTNGNDSLTILLSTNGGASFTRLDSARLSTVWRTKTIVFTSSSATSVIRFMATSDATFTDIGLDNIKIADFGPCSGAPVGGTATTTATPVCLGIPFTLDVTGSTDASGLTYQWQSSPNNTTWTDIAGATSMTLTRTQTVATWYRRVVTCTNTGGSSSNSTSVLVGIIAPSYSPMPFIEDFETTWISSCNVREIPSIYWSNNPVTGDNSWRREDDPTSALWTSTLGLYVPNASSGSHSARFHTYDAASGTSGTFDFYVNCSANTTNRLVFDYINTTGNDSLTVLVSTNGGTTFTRLDSAGIAAAWRTKTIIFNSSSATTIVRFRATSDYGLTDIGVDNIKCSNFAPCAATPVAGTTTTTAVGVICLGTPFTLNISAGTDASGLTYQWQRSTDGITWTNIPGATSESLTTSQNVSTYYRRVITCANGGASASSTSLQIVSPPAVSGTFTINSAGTTALPNFQTFAAAYNYIKCGINGPVVFNVLNGTTGNYNEQLSMTAVPGASATNTVTFKGNGVASIGFASANTNERAVIKLTGTRYIIFDSLVVNANTGTYGYGVQLLNNADSNTVRNCKINSSVTDATQNFGGIIINGIATSITTTSATALNDYNTITDNTITGGFAGVAMVATTTGANGNNIISRNKILDFYQYGIYVAGSYVATIEADSIARPTRTTSAEVSGIYFTGVSTDALVTKNKITNPFGGQLTSTVGFNGINFVACDATSSNPNIVSNNLVFNANGAGAITGLSNNSSDNVYYLHNTISLDNTASTSTATTRGFYQTVLAGGIFFFDNIITISNGGTGAKHCIYLATNTTGIVANYNDYVNNAAAGTNFIGYFSANQASLANWQAATGKDANSISRQPFYNSPATGDYAPTNGGVDNLGIWVDVPVDIRYLPRNNPKPDMGAYEFTAPGCIQPVLGGNTQFDDTTVCQNVPVLLNLSIGAWGTGQTFQWQSSPNLTGPWTNVGAPRAYPDTSITSTISLYYRCEIKCGSSVTTSNPVQLLVTPALPTGNYTINKTLPTNYPTTGLNFTSFNDAKAAMGCGIIGGPVVFNVPTNTGPYVEQLRLDSIAGTSPVNTITFNGNGNTISFASANTNERATIKLNGADYIIFDSLRIDASAGTYGYGVQLINNADTNIFRRCRIISSTTSTATNFAGVVINSTDAGPITTGNTLCDANIFDRDSIVGGYYGVTLVGIAGRPVLENKFTKNIISDYYSTGIYVAGTTNTLIDSNIFIRPTRTTAATPVYSVYVTTILSNSLKVTRNRFTKQFTGAPTGTTAWYGVYHNSIDATAGSENLVANNLFFDLDGNGSLNPLYNTGSDNVRYYHNTISLDNITSTSAAVTQGFYQTTAAIGVEFKNNIVSIRRGGTGTKHAIYFATPTSEIASNNNDFYVKAGGTNNYVGYFNTNQATLANWQAASLKDAASLSIDPTYISPATGDYRPGLLPLDNKGIPVPGVTNDILNVTRSTTTPDIGAYEFSPPVCTSPPVAGAASVTPASGICLEAPIHLTLSGNSAIGTLTFQWQSAPTAAGPWINLSPVQYTPDYDTVTTFNTFYRCVVICSGNTVTSNTVSVTLSSTPMAGVYTINPAGTGARNFTNFQAAVAALQCGIADAVTFNVAPITFTEQVRIPYVPGTSPVKTVTFQKDPVAAGTATLITAATSTLNYTLQLDSASNFIIRNLTISGTNPAFGRVVELINSAYNDTIINCNIIAPVTTSTTNTTAGIYAATFRGRNIVIKGNTITNGANGINYSGTSATVLGNAVVIDSNTVSGSYSHGISTQYVSRIRLRGNTVRLGTSQAANSSGFYMNYCDTAFRLTGNTVTINKDTLGAYGINIQNTRSYFTDSSIVAGNRIIADTANTGALYGIGITVSKGINTLNNVISLNSSTTTTTASVYGIYHLTNTDSINYYNNSISIRGASPTGYAGYFSQAAKAAFKVYNNVFSNPGGGKALFVSNPSNFTADYNMLYSSGALLAQTSTGTVTTFADFKAWTSAWNWDRYSISYPPAFVSATDLRPDIASPNSWAMHGRGTQIKYNRYDFNNSYRPDSLTAGVPDLGAYEFFPSAQPTIMLATPATPAPNVTQTFSYGTDTVMKITWGATAPPTIQVRRFSGVVPSGLLPGTDSMYFYTQVTIPGGGNYPYAAKLYYINPWQGSIPSQNVIGMGRTTPSNAWVVGANSRVNVARKEITQDAIVYLDRFTGLVNPFAQLESEDSSSNRGKDFWVGYQKSWDFTATGGVQEMVIYMGTATQDAHVTISIEGTNGTPWVRNYTVPAGTAITSDLIPKMGTDDARLTAEGQFNKKGIHIVSDVPIVAYAHIYANTNSGATMLMPTSVWGYEYYALSSRQNYTAGTTGPAASAFFIVAKDDSTWVEINPSNPTSIGWVANGGTQTNGSYLVKLNKGDAYQVLGALQSGTEGYDLTGSYVKSIGNAQGACHPIAVFAGSTRTAIGCGGAAGGSGDLIIQQIFPYQAWGNKYLTAPTSIESGPNATSNMQSIFRVLVKDPTTQVKRNGVVLTGIINNRYYQFESSTADYIESNKPVLLAQFMSSNGSCTNTGTDGDPEMFYLSPIQQAIKSTQFYLNNVTFIDENFITLVIPTEGMATLKIDGIGYNSIPAALKYDYLHPNLPGYTVVTKKYTPATGTAGTVESDQPFTGIVYGEGSVESYGYNLGTLVKNLNNASTVNNDLNVGPNATGYTCKNSPFKLKVLLPIQPDSIFWQVSALAPHITPAANVMQTNPVVVDTTQINGIDYYGYVLTVSYSMDTAGTFYVPIQFYSSTIERCDKKQDGRAVIQVLPAPVTNFSVSYPGGGTAACAGDVLNFTGDLITQNGIALNQWQWRFTNGVVNTTPSGQNQSFAYPNPGVFTVGLKGITADGCISDTVKTVTINPRPVVAVAIDSIGVCPAGTVSFTVTNPATGAVYKWYSAPTGGTPLFTGVTYTPTVATLPVSFYVEATSAAGCVSVARKKVTAYQLPLLTAPVVTQTASGANSVTFTWTAVAGAISYEVSVNAGAFTAPSGPGLTHTVTGLGTLSSTSIIVRANGANSCQSSLSVSISGCTNSIAQVVPDSLAVCRDSSVTFAVTPVEAGITYTWYSTATGGTALFTGPVYTVNGINATATYYVEQTRSTSGCTSTQRKRVTVTVLAQLQPPVAMVDTITVNSVRFRWNAVTGAATYQVSVAGGPWITPSSGATGLSHTVTGLRPLDTVSIRVRAIGAITCQTSTSVAVSGRTRPDQIYIPNTFSPNGDGLNDVLQVYSYIIRSLTFTVYNQWGQKIYESSQQNRVWDGTYKGQQQPVGVYIYVCRLTLQDGTVQTLKGTVNLVR